MEWVIGGLIFLYFYSQQQPSAGGTSVQRFNTGANSILRVGTTNRTEDVSGFTLFNPLPTQSSSGSTGFISFTATPIATGSGTAGTSGGGSSTGDSGTGSTGAGGGSDTGTGGTGKGSL